MLRDKKIITKLLITVAIAVYAVILYISPVACPILDLFGVHCLGCGMSRAVISVLRFDFSAAFSYHLMFWSLPLLYLCFLRDGKLFKNKTLNIIFYVIISVGFLANWIRGFFVVL